MYCFLYYMYVICNSIKLQNLRFYRSSSNNMDDIMTSNMKTATQKTATRMIPTGQFPPGKLPKEKIPTQDKFHPEKLLPGKLPPGNFPSRWFPPRKFPPGKIFIQPIATPDNCHPANLIKFNNIQAISQNFLLAIFFSKPYF